MPRWAIVLVLVVGVACGGGDGEERPGAEDVITGAPEKGVVATQLAINRLAVSSRQDLRTAALVYLQDPRPEVRSAALYALAVSVIRDDPEAERALRGFLDAEDEHTRLVAAGAMVSMGAKEGIPVLIDLLASDGPIPYSDPPTSIWAVARGQLLFHTGQDLGLGEAADAESAAAAQADWLDWWEASGDALTWDPDTWTYSG